MPTIHRRDFLRTATRATVLAGCLPLLAACGQSAPASSPSTPASGPPASSPAKPSASSAAPAASSAAATASSKAGPLSPAVTLKVSNAKTAAHAALYIAIERGYFREEGVNIEDAGAISLDAQIPQLGTGRLDVGLNSLVPGLLNAFARGVGVRILSMAIDHQPGRSYPIVARKELIDSGQLKSYADLKGKTYSTTAIPSVAVYALDKALRLGGLKLSDVKLIALSFPNIAVALANKQVDLAFLAEPFATNAIQKGIALKWKEEAEFAAGHPQSIWLGSESLLTTQRDAARRFMVAMLRGGRDYEAAFGQNKGRKEIVDILIKHTTVKDPALYDKMNWAKIPENPAIRMDLLKEDADWLVAQGGIQPLPDLSKLVATDPVQYALQRLGASK
ncbi:MAG: ABC transporter substrate-binding protein [Chloroflexota bacterium]|nr:ABC transporter substrate-binding protein [Chloroflexota bacterium]